MQVAKYIGMTEASEQQLADAFLLVANRHERDPGVRDMCKQLCDWTRAHVERLKSLEARFGKQPSEGPERVRSALFHGVRVGGLGLLRDLQDLALLGHQSHICWTSLSQAANSLHDKDLVAACDTALAEVERQLAWIDSQIKHTAPQALIVTPDSGARFDQDGG
ncbi:MAG TPA: molybdopterin oxidoreductase [Blastocatellia bacterium]|nr:molybdopterin oxidoreductase [Blastocatellia bacterium]